MRGLMKRMKLIAAIPAAYLLSTSAAMASTGGGGGLVWDGPLMTIEQDLTGTVAHAFVIIALISAGLMWSFGEHGQSMRRVAGIVFGSSVALGGASLISELGIGSGATIGQTNSGITAISVLAALLIAGAGTITTMRRGKHTAADTGVSS